MINMCADNIPFLCGSWPLNPELPTIIFIHGAGNSKNLWKHQVQGLNGHINTIAIDLPGHGENNENGTDNINEYARRVENFILAINPPSPVPCGLSMGGAITLDLLVNAKIKFKAGIIVNSGARLKVMPSIFELIKNDYCAYTSSISVMGSSSKTDPARLREIISDSESCSPDVVYDDFTACNGFDITASLKNINIPVLILTAEEDRLTPQKQGIFLADNIPGSNRINIMDAGHFSPAEKPEEVNEAILKFIKINCR
ncbi:MAG TPA: alpha/beta hydrolase [Spirochaetota bacterium]|nr:alpha/beta hydrolase [Spirochaetota bacterium]HPS86219.1 alpha/beta hydrolase [Spirochaetota bacterium]